MTLWTTIAHRFTFKGLRMWRAIRKIPVHAEYVNRVHLVSGFQDAEHNRAGARPCAHCIKRRRQTIWKHVKAVHANRRYAEEQVRIVESIFDARMHSDDRANCIRFDCRARIRARVLHLAHDMHMYDFSGSIVVFQIVEPNDVTTL